MSHQDSKFWIFRTEEASDLPARAVLSKPNSHIAPSLCHRILVVSRFVSRMDCLWAPKHETLCLIRIYNLLALFSQELRPIFLGHLRLFRQVSYNLPCRAMGSMSGSHAYRNSKSIPTQLDYGHAIDPIKEFLKIREFLKP